MPAEWEPHGGTLMEYPVFWKNGDLDAARAEYAAVARAIARFEPVYMLANPGEEAASARSLLDGGDVRVAELPHDDAWARDNGPTFVFDEAGDLIAVNWQFNAWGEKYPFWTLDNQVPRRFCDPRDIPVLDAPLVLEGGSIHTNGAGALLTTAECLLNPNRNPGLTQGEIERHLKYFTGADTVLWLPYGVPQDETDGHVDNVCCFVRDDAVLLYWDGSRRSLANEAVLEKANLHVIHMPAPAGVNLPAASYVNFYIVNGAVAAPAFGVPGDRAARELLAGLFQDREILSLPSLEILRGGGNIHCVTQQIPLKADGRSKTVK
jgi:agmatine deiminase